MSAQFVLSGDVSNVMCYPPPTGFNVNHETDDCDKDSANYKNLAFFGEPAGRNVHRAGNNVLFGDYHVAPYRAFDPAALTFHPRRGGVDWYDLADNQPD